MRLVYKKIQENDEWLKAVRVIRFGCNLGLREAKNAIDAVRSLKSVELPTPRAGDIQQMVEELRFTNFRIELDGEAKSPRTVDSDVLQIIFDLYEYSECRFDHHGYCQEHGWMSSDLCPHKRAKDLLQRESFV